MSVQPLTYESVLELIRENSRKTRREMRQNSRELREFRRSLKEQGAEFDRRMEEQRAENAQMRKELNKKIGELTGRIGIMVDHMIGGRILDKFQALGYAVNDYTRDHRYRNSKLGIKGQIDLILQDGDVAIFIEVKTKLETADVRKHLEQMEKYRRHVDAAKILWPPTTRFLGAVAGAVVDDEAMDFAHENRLYVIVQSGEAVEIVPTPEGFKAKEW